jgi:hypothetical protein
MAPAFTEIAIGRAGDLGLLAVDRLDGDSGSCDELVEAPRQKRIPIGVDDDRGLR